MANKHVESARCACPTRKNEALLLGLNRGARHQMKPTLALLAALFTYCATSGSAIAGDPVYVWLVPPSETEAREATKRMLAVDLPKARELWRSRQESHIAYTVQQNGGLRFNLECDDLPVRIVVDRGQLKSATYEETSGTCKRGTPVSDARFSWDVLTPSKLFGLVSELAGSEEQPSNCLRVTFHPEVGLPTAIAYDCQLVIDEEWFIAVAGIDELED